MAAAIEIKGVSKQYRKGWRTTQALDGLELQVSQGEAFGFVGPNGAGKTTTIKILLNLITRYDGTATIFGANARHPAARYRLGYVPETAAFHDSLTPLELLYHAMTLHRVSPITEKRAMDWLERFGVAYAARKRLRQLSKGTVQRVSLAHAMVADPRLLVLDEPLSGLDPVARKEVVDVLEAYKRAGGTIFFTSHVLHDVERIADRFALILQGKILSTKRPLDLLTESQATVLVRYRGQQMLPGFSTRIDGVYEAELTRIEATEVLQRVALSGGEVLEVRPMLNLEQFFLQAVGKAGHNEVSGA